MTSAKVSYILQRHEARICDISFSSCGSIMISSDEEGICVLWNFESRLPLVSWRAHKGQILSVRLIKFKEEEISTQYVLTMGRADGIKIWKYCSQEPIKKIQQIEILYEGFTSCDLYKNDKKEEYLMVVPNNEIEDSFDTFILTNKRIISLFKGTRNSTSTKVNVGMILVLKLTTGENEVLLFAAHEHGAVRQWKIRDRESPELLRDIKISSSPIVALGIDNHNRIIVAASVIGDEDNNLQNFISVFAVDCSSFSEVVGSILLPEKNIFFVPHVIFSPNNRKFVIAGSDGRMCIYSRNGNFIGVVSIGENISIVTKSSNFTNEKNYIIVGLENGSIIALQEIW